MLLITSAAYAAPELTAEFGHLPPAFLPVGNRRLFVHQCQAVRGFGERILLALPDDFHADPMDAALLERLGVAVLRVPVGLTLGASVVHALRAAAPAPGEPVRLLHGDTLIHGLPVDLPGGLDRFSAGTARGYYGWSEFRREDGGALSFQYGLEGSEPGRRPGRRVVSGYFAFSDGAALVAAIEAAGGDFIAGLTGYAAVRPLEPAETGDWLDFGSLQTYYQSIARFSTARAFNRLGGDRRVVRKASRDAGKIAAEAAWFQALPADLRRFVPAFLGGPEREGEESVYGLERLCLPTLSDLFVFGRLPSFVWQGIAEAVGAFLDACGAHPPPPDRAAAVATASLALHRDKTAERLAAYTAAAGLDPERPWRLNGVELPGLAAILDEVVARVTPPEPAMLGVLHGDLCFSNILYDFRSEAVRVIDPRGRDAAGRPALHGDRRYDLAKLRHSVVGRYDLILAGYHRLEREGPYRLSFALSGPPGLVGLEEPFRAVRLGGRADGVGLDDPAVQAMTVLLFLSMLPLHADDPERQTALLANALRLYAALPPAGAAAAPAPRVLLPQAFP